MRPTVKQVLSEPAGRRLDAWVHTATTGAGACFCGPAPGRYDPDTGICYVCGCKVCPDYSSSWDAAGPLLGRGFGVEACRTARDDKGWLAWQFGSPRESVDGDSGPHAICRALVVAALEDRDGR